eukprot:130838-Chlamydomonas_euryale.AAC.1
MCCTAGGQITVSSDSGSAGMCCTAGGQRAWEREEHGAQVTDLGGASRNVLGRAGRTGDGFGRCIKECVRRLPDKR